MTETTDMQLFALAAREISNLTLENAAMRTKLDAFKMLIAAPDVAPRAIGAPSGDVLARAIDARVHELAQAAKPQDLPPPDQQQVAEGATAAQAD